MRVSQDLCVCVCDWKQNERMTAKKKYIKRLKLYMDMDLQDKTSVIQDRQSLREREKKTEGIFFRLVFFSFHH